MKDLPVDFVAAALDVDNHFSGNVDGRLIKGVAELYGFSSDCDAITTRGGADLLTIKQIEMTWHTATRLTMKLDETLRQEIFLVSA